MLTVLEIIQRTTEFFGGKGVENPRLNAELLVGHALGLKRMQLYINFERPLAEADLEKIRPLVRRRAAREPLQYIVGDVDWHGLKLKCDRRALIPRPETEYLVSLIIEAQASPPSRILDLGTGTGAIALALAKEYPEARVTAIDASDSALQLAAENALALGLAERVEFKKSDWFSQISADSPFDLIAANPPYLSDAETKETVPEVRDYEPHTALTAADHGLSDLRAIISAAPSYLLPGGLLALETGIQQHTTLTALCGAAGFGRVQSKRDLTARDRFVFAWK